MKEVGGLSNWRYRSPRLPRPQLPAATPFPPLRRCLLHCRTFHGTLRGEGVLSRAPDIITRTFTYFFLSRLSLLVLHQLSFIPLILPPLLLHSLLLMLLTSSTPQGLLPREGISSNRSARPRSPSGCRRSSPVASFNILLPDPL